MYTLIDINNGLIAHCETLASVVALRAEIQKGTIYNDDNLLTQSAIALARATWEKGGVAQ